MAVTTTAAFTCAPSDWTEIVDGAAYAACIIQSAGPEPLAVAIAAAKPSATTNAYILVQGTNPAGLTLSLDASDSVWAKGTTATAYARLARTAR